MKVLSFAILLIFSGVLFAQNKTRSSVQYLNYDPFYQQDSLPSNPILPIVGNAPTFAKRWIWSENKQHHYSTVFPVMNAFGAYKNNWIDEGLLHFLGGIGIENQLGETFYSRIILPAQVQWVTAPFTNFDTAFDIVFAPQIRLSFSPYKFINIQAGIDQNFIGHGNRSLLLSDYGKPYPFVQLRSKIWKIEMLNLYQFFEEQKGSKKISKFASTHFFNYNITKRWQVGLFESVVFAPKDTLLNRGYELDYLNPFLFYRPTEYLLGSQDRLLIGLNTAIEWKNFMIYGQLAIDDFVLHELLDRTRWWANKYGGQIGFKAKKNMNNNMEWRGLIELNAVRPFMYSHVDYNTVYGNAGLPLAHPLGANFAEIFAETSLTFPSTLTFKTQAFFVQQGGFDSQPTLSYGNDIYQSYLYHPFEYGYKIGGNGQVNRLNLAVETNYILSKKLNLLAFIRPSIELNDRYTPQLKSYFWLFSGIRSNLWNERKFSF